MSCCLLDEGKFHWCCQLLLQQSDELRDGWTWETVQGSQEGYLRKTVIRPVAVDTVQSQEELHSSLEPQGQEPEQSTLTGSVYPGDITEDLIDEDDNGVCMVTEGSSRLLQCEYHILYSCSYSVPVLYFRASTQEGRSLTLEEVWSSVHPNFQRRLKNSPLNTIAQQEHPLLGQPFFMLHPCRTEEFMRPMLQAAQEKLRPVNYVLSWLSAVGPVVGLDVPLKYCT
ncbi:ubiquitin-like-conjugating enzyme ATG10 isoform 1-T1 [Pholidichthys leucotaenia]